MSTSELKLTQQEPSPDGEDAPPGAPEVRLPERDVRRKRPPALLFLLRVETARTLLRIVSLMAIDLVGLYGAMLTALLVKDAILGPWDPEKSFNYAGQVIWFAYLVMVLLFARSSLYANRAERAGLAKVVSGLFQTTVVILLFALITTPGYFNTYFIFYGTLFFAAVYIGLLRFGYERMTGFLLRVAGHERRALLVGSGKQIEAVAHAFQDAGQRIDLIGYLSLTPRPDNGLRSLGPVEGLPSVLDAQHVDEVIIADPDFPQDRAIELVDECHRRGVRVRVAPSTMGILTHRAELVPGQTLPLFELTPPVFEGFDYLVKRSFDLVVAVGLLVGLTPLLAGIAIAVRLSSHGPILYRSPRPGIGGRSFDCFKFRTMANDADQRQADLESLNEASGALFKLRQDPRLTSAGGFLRRYSFDELPQLLNVLRGEMSLVGPRPLPQRDFERLEDWHKKRYLVLPGITGLWQVSGRSELDFDDLVKMDFSYLENWSVSLDLSILLKTVPAVLTRRGAF